MRARASIRLFDGTLLDLGPGDLIGRLWHATVTLDDPRVSEAHAMVSLRAGSLRLLGLRGRFAVAGVPRGEVDLVPGLEVVFAEGIGFVVEDVVLPDAVLGIETDGLPPRILAGTCALVDTPGPALAPPTHPHARAWLWTSPGGWRIRLVGGPDRPLEAGDTVEVAGRPWRAVLVPTGVASPVTRVTPGLDDPLTIVTRYETVHLFRPHHDPVVLRGLPARLISELAAMDAPAPWRVLLDLLWPDGGSRKQLDMVLVRLRARLRQGRIRSDLVQATGRGSIELLLRAGDRLEDQA